MAAMMLMLLNFNNADTAIIKIISINIIAAISWPPSLISQLFFTQDFFKAALFFYSLAVFEWISLPFCIFKIKALRLTISSSSSYFFFMFCYTLFIHTHSIQLPCTTSLHHNSSLNIF